MMIRNILTITFFFLSTVSFAQKGEKHFNSALDYVEQEKYTEALMAIDSAISQDTTVASYFSLRASILTGLGDYKASIETLNYALQVCPDTAYLYNMRGMIFDLFKIYDKAIFDFTLAVNKAESDGEKSTYLTNRSGAKFASMDYHGAYRDASKALSLDSTSINAMNNLAIASDEIGKPNDALTYLRKIMEIDSLNVPGYINLGYKYRLLEKYDSSVIYLNKAIELDNTESYAFSNRSYSRWKLGDWKGAMEDINQSIELMPTNSYAYWVRAQIKLEKRKTRKTVCEDLDLAIKHGYTTTYGNNIYDLIKEHCKDEEKP